MVENQEIFTPTKMDGHYPIVEVLGKSSNHNSPRDVQDHDPSKILDYNQIGLSSQILKSNDPGGNVTK